MPLPSSLAAVLDWHSQRYPLLQAQDIYKLTHQGVFGPGHIIASAAQAKRMLRAEMAALKVRSSKSKGRSRTESEFEPLDPKHRLVRVNLRPLAAAQCKVQDARYKMQDTVWLVEALVGSGRRVKGDPKQMKRRLSAAVRWCQQNLPRQAAELERMAAQAEESGYPAFHHSPAYSRAYRPAYRVILRACLRRLHASGTAG